MCGIFAHTQTINYPDGDILLYSDTSTLVDGSELVISLYGQMPVKIAAYGLYIYEFSKVYSIDGEELKDETLTHVTYDGETLLISGVQRTYDWMYPQVITVDEANWKIASWQTYLQKIHNQ